MEHEVEHSGRYLRKEPAFIPQFGELFGRPGGGSTAER